MSLLKCHVLRQYAIGLGCTFMGAWGVTMTDSMLPLALGAAVSIMTTAPLARSLWHKKPASRQ